LAALPNTFHKRSFSRDAKVRTFAVRLPRLLQDKVYFGVSAGSAMETPGLIVDRERYERTGIYHDDEYEEAAPPNAGSD